MKKADPLLTKKRLDLILLERGLASTRTKAQELIAAGAVQVEGKVVSQPGAKFSQDVSLIMREKEHPYVSRGGLKLAGALRDFDLSVSGKRVLDLGQSTGGFTHCLLLAGAAGVVGVDVGSGQLASELRTDPRVKFFEQQDIRTLDPSLAGPPFAFVVADLAFISLTLVLPILSRFLVPGAEGLLLVKPQFELDAASVGAGGIVRDGALRERALSRVEAAAQSAGFTVAGKVASSLPGGDGNLEYFLHVRWPSSAT